MSIADLFVSPTPIDVTGDFGLGRLGESLTPYSLKAVFVVGAGGSGKSTIADDMFGSLGLKRVDQDQHLERITLEKGRPLSDVGASYTDFKAAQAQARQERDQYATERLGMVIDATGWEYARVAEPMKRLRDEYGYDCYMVFVTASLETALERNAARAAAGGRKVPDSSIERAHRGVHANLLAYRNLFGKANIVLIKNDKAIDPEEWERSITPYLRDLGQRIVNRPVRNPIGRKWVREQDRFLRLESPDRPTVLVPAGLFEFDSLSIEEAAKSDAYLDRPFSRSNDEGDTYIMLGDEQIGQIQYAVNRQQHVEVSYIEVRPAYRRGGHATTALRQFVKQARKAGMRGLDADIVWRGSLDLFMRVLGRPDYLGDDVHAYGVNQARKQLSADQVEDPDGSITHGNKVYARWDW